MEMTKTLFHNLDAYCLSKGYENDCDDSVVEIEYQEVPDNSLLEVEKLTDDACFDTEPESEYSEEEVGDAFSLAHRLGKMSTKVCYPRDQGPHENGALLVGLEVAQRRKEKILASNTDYPSGGSDNTLDDSGVSTHDTGSSARCRNCACPVADTDDMDTSSNEPIQDSKYEWERKRVTSADLEIMKRWQGNKLPLQEIEHDGRVNTWFEYLPIQANDGSYRESRYRCYYCHKYGKDFLFHKRYLSSFSKSSGIFHPISAKNRNAILAHAKSKSHRHII